MVEYHPRTGTVWIEANLKDCVTLAIADSDGGAACIHLTKQDIKNITDILEDASYEVCRMSDGAGTICDNCGGWIHLHHAIIDGEKMLTGKCYNCGQYTDVIETPKPDTGEKVMDYDSYPGKGQFVVEIRRPGQPVRGCRYENAHDAISFFASIPTIPGGSIGVYSITGFGLAPRTIKWPKKESDIGNASAGRIDAMEALLAEFKHAEAYEVPIQPEALVQWAEESETIEGQYGKSVRLTIKWCAESLEAELSSKPYEVASKNIVKWLEEDLHAIKEATA